ncbi:MAG: hypothetical protein AB7G15_01840 [Alphaproteobacteria bacterium]
MRQLRLLLALCFVGMAGLLSSCIVEVEEFLTDKAQAKPDARLYGVWIWAERGETMFVQVRPHRDNPKLMQLTYMDVKPGATPPVGEWRRYAAWPTRLGAIDYLNLELEDGSETKNARRLVIRYDVSPKAPAQVMFSVMSDDAVRAAFKQGDLAGREEGGQYDKWPIITTNRGLLRDYLRVNATRLFPARGTTLTRAANPEND